jgi:UDP-N-acetylmuramoyl-tripeptide--D-alanyl-D-alanine ligase
MSTLWTSKEIATAVGGTANSAWNATGISIDTRTLKPGDLFVALKGPNFDADTFAGDALAKGAAGALVSRATTADEKLIVVSDTLRALEKLAAASRTRSDADIIAVTGSVGKTGCKEALRQVLSAQGPTHASQGSYNNHWGVPLSLSQMPADAEYGVFEIGMNHIGELGPLSKMVRPYVALITGIAAVHIGNFKDLNEIANAKAEIFEGLEPGGAAVLPGDDTYYKVLAAAATKYGAKIHRFGKGDGYEAQLLRHQLYGETSRVTARIRSKEYTYDVGAPGMHWVTNSLAVLLCASLAGADVARAADAFKTLKLATGRGSVRVMKFADGSFTLVDESYNASPVSIEAAISVLAQRQPAGLGRRILVLGDMKELGEQSKKLHSALAAPIEDARIDLVFAAGDEMRALFEALPKNQQGAWKPNSSELAPVVAGAIQNGDIVTVKGSHSMMMERVVAALAALEAASLKSA